MKPTLSVNHLAVRVKSNQHPIVEPITFDLFPGKSLCILGETGAGKSVLAQAILGNLSPDLVACGEVWINGQEWLQAPLKARQQLWGHTITLF